MKVFIAISVAVFAFSALFLKVERCQKDSGGDYSHLWFVSGSVLNVDSSGDFTMSVESEDPYNDRSDRLTILVEVDFQSQRNSLNGPRVSAASATRK